MVDAELRAESALRGAESALRGRRRKGAPPLPAAAAGYAALGWPVCQGAALAGRAAPRGGSGRACSCDRVGCPAPGGHPLSPAWQREASADPAVVARWWQARPDATILLVTGRVFDALDVPAAAVGTALDRLRQAGVRPGPVAVGAGDRALFFVASRAVLAGDDEWWSCHLDCAPETVPAAAGLRWHCRDSYVVAPPSRLAGGQGARWVIQPGAPHAAGSLPDALRLLGHLADACEEIA